MLNRGLFCAQVTETIKKKRFKPDLSDDSEKSGSRTRSQFEKVTLNHFLKALLVVDTVSKVTISNGHNFIRSQFQKVTVHHEVA